jgi:tRNA (guanine6-N2)-methyltransferase
MLKRSPMETVQYLARCIRGLEWVLAAEVSARLAGHVTQVDHRDVYFCAPLSPGIASLGSADDLFIVAGQIADVPHTRDGLRFLADAVASLPLNEALEALTYFGRIASRSQMEVIASFLGKRNYSRGEIEDAVGGALSHKLSFNYVPHDRENQFQTEISWRIHIRNRQAVLGLRIAPRPLHRRSWRLGSRPGSLHPPVAFAMAMLADLSPGMLCLDPFCGAATILIEAQRFEQQIRAVGSDIDAAAFATATANAMRARVGGNWIVADAGQMPYPNHVFDRIISNPPWGHSVAQKGALQSDREAFGQELQRVLARDGTAVLLTLQQEQMSLSEPIIRGWSGYAFRIRVSGRLARISVINAQPRVRAASKLAVALAESWKARRLFHKGMLE